MTEDIKLSAALPAITGDLTLDGGGHTLSGDRRFRILEAVGARLVIRNLTLTQGKGQDGGALRIRAGATVEIRDSVFSDNRAETGGAISTLGGSNHLTIEDSRFRGNSAVNWAGAIDVVNATVTIKRSSFTKYTVRRDYGGVLVMASSQVEITNSTFHNNRAHYGATIHVFGHELTMAHVTMTNNNASIGIGHAINRQDGIVRLRNSIIAGPGSGDDCANGLQEAIGNLSTDGSCALLPSDNARLGQLTGAPAWRPLLNGSPAIDAAAPEFCPETDQVGTPRPHGGACDIGAIETTTAIPAAPPIEPPPPCPLALQIIAANTDAPAAARRVTDTTSSPWTETSRWMRLCRLSQAT